MQARERFLCILRRSADPVQYGLVHPYSGADGYSPDERKVCYIHCAYFLCATSFCPLINFCFFKGGSVFTGLVQTKSHVLNIIRKRESVTLTIAHAFDDLVTGESIAVDGACLTVVDFNEQQFSCQLSPETLNKTIAQFYEKNAVVNLERAMRLSDRFGGHIVTGHVDEKIRVLNISAEGRFISMQFGEASDQYLKCLINKGSVTVNGVSLTINQVFDDGFSVMLIPETLDKTNLFLLRVNQLINVEYDYLAKIVLRRQQVMEV